MTRHLFTSALFAGLAAGLCAALLSYLFILPLTLEGELYEEGIRVHFAASLDAPVQSPSGPADFQQRDASDHLKNVISAVISYTAFALLLVAGMALAARAGQKITARKGIIWGLAGFIALHLAPAFGLAPELPGTIGAEIESRQVWWLATVTCTVLGLCMIAFGNSIAFAVIGVVALALPHIIGAPQLDTYFGIAPPELSALYVARSLGVAAASWVILGTLAAYFWTRNRAETD